jgi:hypothetical protein
VPFLVFELHERRCTARVAALPFAQSLLIPVSLAMRSNAFTTDLFGAVMIMVRDFGV